VIEIDEEQEVGAKDDATKDSGRLGTSAGAGVGQVGCVGESKVCVGAVVDDDEIDDELDDLHGRQVLFPPDLGSRGRAEVIIVHENVNRQIERDGDPRNRGLAVELNIAEAHGHAMVEVVQELELFFLRNKKTVSISSQYLTR